MADNGNYVFSVFEMMNRLGYFVPRFNVRFDEADTGKVWFISGGGTRCYVARIETRKSVDVFEQAADSHFMMNRIVGSLLISGAGSSTPQDFEDLLSLVCWPRGDRFLARGRHCLQL